MKYTIQYDGKIIEADNVDTFTYGGVSHELLQELNEEKYNEVKEHIKYYIDNFEKIQKEEIERKREEIYQKQLSRKNDFIKQVEDLNIDFGEFEVEYLSPLQERPSSFVLALRLLYQGKYILSGGVKFDDEVFNGWRHQKTDRCWVMDFNYRNMRYKSLEKAILSLIKKSKQQLSSEILQQEKETLIKAKLETFKKFCKDHDLEFIEQYVSSKFHSYYEYYGRRHNIKFKLMCTDNLEVSVIEVIFDKPSEEQIKRFLRVQ